SVSALADDNGEYTILNVQVGTYTVVATFIGYEPSKQSNVKVSVDLKTKVNFGLVSGGSNIHVDTLEVVAQRKGIEVEQSGRQIDQEQIKNSGIQGVNNLVSKTA